MWNAADLRGTRDGPAALVTFEGMLRGTIEGAWEGPAIGVIVRRANFGGAGRGAEKCSLGVGWASARRARQLSVDINAETIPCSLTTGLFSTFRVRTAKLQRVNNGANYLG